ncbi:MAG: imidazole glycerol phosphate synthase subunit HisH [Planctomycetota bacterium]|jgi:glutamine amidotransferase|nr:imidazole glycerol phosphate synthase subunit HisH [Planctomycetota bacterium]
MLAIIDYEAGNLTSVKLAVEHLGGASVVTSDPAVVASADRVIFPGVGYAETCMTNLKRRGLDAALRAAYAAGKPLLAICIGMQLLFSTSAEGRDGAVPCLDLLAGEVVKFSFPASANSLASAPKIPHMGWNAVVPRREHPLLKNFRPASEAYFVHSYYVAPRDAADIIAETEYGGKIFPSMVGKNNLVAAQFHPEKSGAAGLQMLQNFIEWDGRAINN